MVTTYYEYYNRGKCNNCGMMIWNDNKNSSIMCACNKSSIIIDEFNNVSDVTDEEFIDAVRSELLLASEENIVIIKIN